MTTEHIAHPTTMQQTPTGHAHGNRSPVSRNQVTAVILGAGQGRRLHGSSKSFLELNGFTLVEMVVEAVAPLCDEIVVGLHADDLGRGEALLRGRADWPAIRLLAGGATRQETLVRLANDAGRRYILLHEVARPFASQRLYRTVLEAVKETGAASLFTRIPPRDSLALATNGQLTGMVPRNDLVALQTPHAYRRDYLLEAHMRAEREGWQLSGTAELMWQAGYPVTLVPGDADNVKITYLEDWDAARQHALSGTWETFSPAAYVDHPSVTSFAVPAPFW